MVPPDTTLDRLRSLWVRETVGPGRRLATALLSVALLGAVLLGRVGTTTTRVAAIALMVAAVAGLLLTLHLARRRRRDPARLVHATIVKTEPALGAATIRALDLAERATHEPDRGSPELARLHLGRLLAGASTSRIAEHASRLSWQRSILALTAAAACCIAVVYDPLRVVEGLDVLAARRGVAPVALSWLSDPRVVAKAPPHLDERPRSLEADGATSLPQGSLVTVIGQARHDDRPLVLTDGALQIPFVDDGRGALSAGWTVRHDSELRIAARFGDTLILQPGGLEVHAVADLPPVIRLDGAPKTIALLDQPEVSLRYQVLDDHGLTEVSLVLRAGVREQRRSLSQLRGTSRSAQGALVLRMDDEFIKQSFLPVEATIEARDNDGFLGP